MRQVRGRHVIRLEAADGDLRVPAAVHGPLVDVSAPDYDVLHAGHFVVLIKSGDCIAAAPELAMASPPGPPLCRNCSLTKHATSLLRLQSKQAVDQRTHSVAAGAPHHPLSSSSSAPAQNRGLGMISRSTLHSTNTHQYPAPIIKTAPVLQYPAVINHSTPGVGVRLRSLQLPNSCVRSRIRP